jgi:hypothetical protein
MSGKKLVWPNPSPRKVGYALRKKISPILQKNGDSQQYPDLAAFRCTCINARFGEPFNEPTF